MTETMNKDGRISDGTLDGLINLLKAGAGCNGHYALLALQELAELRRTPPARSIDAGDGYVLVPREPTEAMKTAGMDVLMYRIETITPSDLWRAMLAAAPSPPPAKKVGPTTNAAAFELSIYEGVRDRLARLTAGTCSCNTKSPELRYHSERCHYRVAREALDLLLAAPPPPAKEAE